MFLIFGVSGFWCLDSLCSDICCFGYVVSYISCLDILCVRRFGVSDICVRVVCFWDSCVPGVLFLGIVCLGILCSNISLVILCSNIWCFAHFVFVLVLFGLFCVWMVFVSFFCC